MRGAALLIAMLGVFGCMAHATLSEFLNQLPACSLPCISTVLPDTGCALNNSTCTCSEDFTLAANLCIEKNCTIIESLQAKNISARACNLPIESRSTSLIGTVALGGIAALVLNVRLASRWILEGRFQSDDWVMIAVDLILGPFGVVGCLTAVKGFGRNIWEIPVDDVTSAFEYFYWGSIIYVTVISLCKISILIFYIRIFPYDRFRIACNIILAWVIITMILFQLLSLLQCLPISYNWEGWKFGDESTKCLDLTALAYASAAINIAQDIVILILPVPWLVNLNTTKRKKINILIMFNIGIFLCICSIVRLTKIVALKDSQNKTWDYVSTIYWTAIEVYVAIIIPCLPATRRLLIFKFPHIFKSDPGSRFTYERTDPPSFKMKVTRGTITRIIDDERNVENGESSRSREVPPHVETGDELQRVVEAG